MAYGPETHNNFVRYDCVLEHTSGVRASVSVDIYNIDGSTPAEATRDQVFQVFLTRLSGMAGTTVISAEKRGEHTATVTP